MTPEQFDDSAYKQVIVHNQKESSTVYADMDKIYFILVGEGFLSIQAFDRKTAFPVSQTYYPNEKISRVDAVFETPPQERKTK